MRKAVCFLVFITLMLSHRALAQVINSMSPNKMGIYTHALDTVMTCLKKEKPLRVVYVKGEKCAVTHLPSTQQGLTIKTDDKSLRKKRRLKEAEVFVTINCLSIDRDYITIIMIIFDGQPKPFVATYQYHPTWRKCSVGSLVPFMFAVFRLPVQNHPNSSNLPTLV